MYNQEEVNKLNYDYSKIYLKSKKLILLGPLISEKLINNDAKEYILNGFARRVKIIYRCIENIFNLLPIDEFLLYKNDKIEDATINLHAFFINISGLLDNLALVFWLEKKPLNGVKGNIDVGFDKKDFRKNLSEEFQEYLMRIENLLWQKHLINYRHALAHRIPPYIPPIIDKKTGKEIQRIILKHSIFEEKKDINDKNDAVYFHPQLIADFNTIEEFSYKFLDELFDKKFMKESKLLVDSLQF